MSGFLQSIIKKMEWSISISCIFVFINLWHQVIRITQVFVCLLPMMRMNLNMFQSVTRKQCTMPYILCNPMWWQHDGLEKVCWKQCTVAVWNHSVSMFVVDCPTAVSFISSWGPSSYVSWLCCWWLWNLHNAYKLVMPMTY